jgi:hypothetical protein
MGVFIAFIMLAIYMPLIKSYECRGVRDRTQGGGSWPRKQQRAGRRGGGEHRNSAGSRARARPRLSEDLLAQRLFEAEGPRTSTISD